MTWIRNLLFCLAITIDLQAHALTVRNVETPTAVGQITWLQQLKLLRHGIKQCEMITKSNTWDCFKIASLRVFDRLLNEPPSIPIWYGVRFVRESSRKMLDIASSRVSDEPSDLITDLANHSWFDSMARRLARAFHTHFLEINLSDFTNAYMRILERQSNYTVSSIGSGRFRRHRQNMLITMIFGVTAVGAILVPLGFQLLSVVSGKALLLAKMALLLASINGLKRVANSGVHYGLYHVPGEHYNGVYERGDAHHPRNVIVGQPIEDMIGMQRKL